MVAGLKLFLGKDLKDPDSDQEKTAQTGLSTRDLVHSGRFNPEEAAGPRQVAGDQGAVQAEGEVGQLIRFHLIHDAQGGEGRGFFSSAWFG